MSTEWEELEEGLAIYKQKNSKNYYVSITKKNNDDPHRNSIKKSLRTPDRYEAITKAKNMMAGYTVAPDSSTFAVEHKISLTRVSKELVEILKTKAEKSLRKEPQEKRQASIIEKDFRPYFKNLGIDDFTHKLMKTILIEVPTNKTKARNVVKCFKLIIEHAIDEEYIEHYKAPPVPSPTLADTNEQQRRISFEANDEKILQSNFDAFISATNKKASKINRFYLEKKFRFLQLTGCRPGSEVDNLTFSNIVHNDNINRWQVIFTKGKTANESNPRTINVKKELIELINEIAIEAYNEPFQRRNYRHAYKYIFRRPNRQNDHMEWTSYFEQYIEYCMKLKNPLSRRYSLYSCRHTFITDKLRKKEMQPWELAEYCGTSPQMIDEYYSDIRAEEIIANSDSTEDETEGRKVRRRLVAKSKQ